MKHVPVVGAMLLALGGPLRAQDSTVPARLTLDQAIEIARAGNPALLQTRNDEDLADWDVRQAYGSLIPSAGVSAGVNWQGSGETQLGGNVTLGDLGISGQPSYYGSNYNLGINYSLDWATLLGPKQTKTARRATIAGIEGFEWSVVTQVTDAYVEILRQMDRVRIAQLILENNEFNLRLAQGQLAVGQVTPIDVGQAEVQVGRSQVALLQAENAVVTSRMRLLQLMGLRVDQDFETTTTFELIAPDWTLDDLIGLALDQNPELRSRRLAAEVADVGVSSAWSAYFPTLSMSAGWSGFTREASTTDFQLAQAQSGVRNQIAQCVRTNDIYARLTPPLPAVDCSGFAFTDEQAAAIVAANDQFPFGFNTAPPSVGLTLSIPIFNGLSRQRNLEASRLQREDEFQRVREQELAVQADLAIALENVRTAYESAELEERNRILADQQLTLARERYQLGAITFVELVDAQTVLAQAEADRATALFAYHDLVTTLEGILGTSLRFTDPLP